jgi:hypothetical protein
LGRDAGRICGSVEFGNLLSESHPCTPVEVGIAFGVRQKFLDETADLTTKLTTKRMDQSEYQRTATNIPSEDDLLSGPT